MCGYQSDNAVTKNDTHEKIWYHFTSRFELSNQIDCNNFISIIFYYYYYYLLRAWYRFIHSFLIPYRSLARRLACSRCGIKNSWLKTISGS